MRNNIILLILLTLFSLSVQAKSTEMIIEHYSTESGIPNNMVNYSLKDRDGFMWFGTWYGLSRFDGNKFKNYNVQINRDSDIPPSKIQRILEDDKGYIWVNTIDRKLYVFNKYKETFHSVYNEMKGYTSNLQVIKIDRNSCGEIIVLTKDKNLLLAKIENNDSISISNIVSSKDRIDASNFQLKSNIFYETTEYLSWVGCDFKTLSLKKNSSSDFIKRMNLSDNEKLNCIFNNDNMIWIGSSKGNFYQININNGLVRIFSLPQLHNVSITNIIVASDKTLYINTYDKGTYVYDLHNKQLKKIDLNLNNKDIEDIYIDKYDKVWFHEKDKALIFYDPDNRSSKRFEFKSNTRIGTLYIEDAGARGIFFLAPSGEALYFDRSRLTMRSINEFEEIIDVAENQSFFHMYLDKDGILWLSSTTNGIYRISFPKQSFNVYVPQGLENAKEGEEGVRALYQTKNGDIWVGSRKKLLYRMDRNGVIKHIYPSNQIGSVYNILEDNRGNIWISTKRNGLYKGVSDGKGNYIFTNYKHDPNNPNSISGNDIYYSFQDHNNNIWIATLDGGLNLIIEKNNEIYFMNKFNGFKNYPKYGLFMETRNIVEDKNNRIWVGTMDGLMSFNSDFKDPETIDFEIYRNKDKTVFFHNDIYTLYKDKGSNIWIGSFGTGLSRLVSYNNSENLPEFKSYDINHELNNNVIKSFVEDDSNHLWLSTEKGISSYDFSNGHIRNYDKYDGFPLVRLEDNTALYTQDKELWIGCKEGILIFSPDALENNSLSYNTFIVDCRISNKELSSYNDISITSKSIEYSDKLVLNHNQSMFSFEFSALNYYNQNRVSYRYILQGYEDEWHYNGINRIASYSNVPPGDYTFIVETLDNANPKLKSFKEIKITILPPWWATWWAYTIYTLIAIGLVIFAIRLSLLMIRVKNDIYIEQKISELKIKFFTNISHELRTPLTLIQGPIEELRDKEQLSDKGKMYIELMNKNIIHMLQLVNQLLDFRKIQNGKMRLHVSLNNLNDMIRELKEEFDLMAEENDISFSLEMPNEDIEVWVDKEKINTVIRNILSNTFKFTPVNGVINIKIEKIGNSKCEISVYDNGPTIPKEDIKKIFERFSQSNTNSKINTHGTGIGLALSKEIIGLHHGLIYADENVTQGARFVIELNLGKDVFKPGEVDFYINDRVNIVPTPAVKQDKNINEEEPIIDPELPTIQIVEDNRDLCNMLKLQLNNKYNIITAHNGVEGLKCIEVYNPDLIVSDQMMPEMDGLKMLEKIRNDFQISHIPVIMLTAKGDDESRIKAISLGANSYITKPFSKDFLIASIDQLLHERQIFQERMRILSNVETASSSESYEQYIEKRDLEFMQKIHHIINENMDNFDFNIDTIAATIGLSRSSFFKKLKSLTGFAPVDLVKDIRLNKSVDLIRNTDMTISEIAFTVGFRDSGYFSKCFKKKYDKTPREYILECRKG